MAGGGEVRLDGLTGPLPFRWFNPKTGECEASGTINPGDTVVSENSNPWVLIAGVD